MVAMAMMRTTNEAIAVPVVKKTRRRRGIDRIDFRKEEQWDPESAKGCQEYGRRSRCGREANLPRTKEMRHDRPVGKADHRNCALVGDEIPKSGEKTSQLRHMVRFSAAI